MQCMLYMNTHRCVHGNLLIHHPLMNLSMVEEIDGRQVLHSTSTLIRQKRIFLLIFLVYIKKQKLNNSGWTTMMTLMMMMHTDENEYTKISTFNGKSYMPRYVWGSLNIKFVSIGDAEWLVRILTLFVKHVWRMV